MLAYTQLAQVRLSGTTAASIYQCAIGEEVQLFIKAANVGNSDAGITFYHDHNGSTYDLTTAITGELLIPAGGLFELDHVFVNNPSGNVAYKTSVGNAFNVTVYGVVKSE